MVIYAKHDRTENDSIANAVERIYDVRGKLILDARSSGFLDDVRAVSVSVAEPDTRRSIRARRIIISRATIEMTSFVCPSVWISPSNFSAESRSVQTPSRTCPDNTNEKRTRRPSRKRTVYTYTGRVVKAAVFRSDRRTIPVRRFPVRR